MNIITAFSRIEIAKWAGLELKSFRHNSKQSILTLFTLHCLKNEWIYRFFLSTL